MELRIEGVSKTCASGVRALRDLTLTIPPGMYGLLGPGGLDNVYFSAMAGHVGRRRERPVAA